MPKASPSSSTKISGHLSRHYIFYCFIYYVLFLEHQFFFLSVCFVLFAVVYGWILAYLFGEIHAPFSLPRTLQFSLLLFCEYSIFASTAFSSCFPLVFCLELIGLLQFYMISSLSLMIITYESCFKQVDWCWRRVKYFMLIVVQKEACFDCGLGFGMSCQMLF